MKLSALAPLLISLLLSAGCAPLPTADRAAAPRYEAARRDIAVDGDPSDWKDIAAVRVAGEDHLWFGQGMTREKWLGTDDLSYTWRAAWSGDRLHFLVEVTDDRVIPAGAPASYLSDCVEIYLDPRHRGGPRVQVLDGRADWFDRCDPRELRGYELHFLPTAPPRVYLDHSQKYAADRPHNERFAREWAGQAACRRTAAGYALELSFAVPGLKLARGQTLGLEVGVCDDDGAQRKSILMWTGTKVDFWLSMDAYGALTLTGESTP